MDRDRIMLFYRHFPGKPQLRIRSRIVRVESCPDRKPTLHKAIMENLTKPEFRYLRHVMWISEHL